MPRRSLYSYKGIHLHSPKPKDRILTDLAWVVYRYVQLEVSDPSSLIGITATQLPCMRESSMNKLLLMGAAFLMIITLLPDEAFAQRGGGRGGGGFGGGFSRGGGGFGGGFRGASIGGGGFRGAAIGGAGFRGAAIGGYRGGFYRGGLVGGGYRGGFYRGGLGYRYGAWRPGWGWRARWPVVAGIGLATLGYYGYPYYSGYYDYDQCTVWNGYAWVNTCYY